MLLMNEQVDPWVERRTATAIGSTAGIPQGTLVTAPVVQPTGATGTAPVVAVNVISRWKSKVNILSVAVLPVLTWLYTWLTSAKVVAFEKHPLVFAGGVTVLGFVIGYFRTTSNVVVRS
jgi:hypothetical protein